MESGKPRIFSDTTKTSVFRDDPSDRTARRAPVLRSDRGSTNTDEYLHGIYYTPFEVADAISGRVLDLYSNDTGSRLTVVDPFCGHGVFLKAVARVIAAGGFTGKLNLIGTDADLDALSVTGEALGEMEESLRDKIEIEHELAQGDSFGLGRDFWGGSKDGWNFDSVSWPELLSNHPSSSGKAEADIVLSNPPYLSFYGRHSRGLTRGMKRKIKSRFKGSIHSVNTYVLSVLVALEIVRNGGVIGLLIPSSFLRNRRFRRAREHLADQCSHVEFGVLGRVFAGASIECGVLVLKKDKPRRRGKILLSDWKSETRKCSVPVNVFVGGCGERVVRLPHGLLSRIWEGAVPVRRIASVRDGVNPGPATSRAKLITDSPGIGLLPLLRGSDILRYRVSIPGKWIRYDPGILSEEEFRRGASLRKPEVFRPPKIVTRQTACRIIAALDEVGYICLNSVHSTRLIRNHQDISLLGILLGLFNSSLINCLYRIRYGETVKAFPQVHVYALNDLPVRGHPQASAWERHIAARLGELAITAGRAGSADPAQEEEIDRLTCELYGIKEYELKTLMELAGME
jgi:hypothetical protein